MTYRGTEIFDYFFSGKRARLVRLADPKLDQRLPDRFGDVVERLLAVLTEIIPGGTLSGLVKASHESIVNKNMQIGDCMLSTFQHLCEEDMSKSIDHPRYRQ